LKLCFVAAGVQPKLLLPPPPDANDQFPRSDVADLAAQQHSSRNTSAVDNSFSSSYGLQPLYRDSDPELRRCAQLRRN